MIRVENFWKYWYKATYSKRFSPSWILGKIIAKRIMYRQNSEIPYSNKINPFDIPHGLNGILISSKAEIGKHCTIFHQVTIGSNTSKGSKGCGAPVIGDNVYIGAGAKVIGKVKIGNNARIGANCVVVKDVPANCTAVLRDPCRIILHDSPRDNSFVSIDKSIAAQ